MWFQRLNVTHIYVHSEDYVPLHHNMLNSLQHETPDVRPTTTCRSTLAAGSIGFKVTMQYLLCIKLVGSNQHLDLIVFSIFQTRRKICVLKILFNSIWSFFSCLYVLTSGSQDFLTSLLVCQ